jgi:hypothetical protein
MKETCKMKSHQVANKKKEISEKKQGFNTEKE